jgi:O-antigen/teichoic acid export membrane protein
MLVLTRVTPASPEFRRASGLYLRGVAWTVIPGAALASVLADPLVRTLYGATWLEAIPLVPLAMVGAAFAALSQTAYTVLLAAGHQRACVFTDAWRTAGILGALVLALPDGPATYLAALSGVHGGALLVTSILLWRARAMAEPVLLEALAPAVVEDVPAPGALLVDRIAEEDAVDRAGGFVVVAVEVDLHRRRGKHLRGGL